MTHGQAAELPVLGPWHRGTVPYHPLGLGEGERLLFREQRTDILEVMNISISAQL